MCPHGVSNSALSQAAIIGRLSCILLIATTSVTLLASPSSAQKHYRAGDYKAALRQYQQLIEKDPADPRLRYNAGSAAYKASSFDEAIKQFQAAIATPDLQLQQQAYYNLANSEFRLGEGAANPQEKIALWEQSLQHYDATLKLNSQDADARFNRDLVQQRLEELKKQQQQQQQNQQQNNNQDQQKDDQQQDQQNNKQDQQQKQDKQNQDNNPEQKQDQQQSQDQNQQPEDQQQSQNQEQQQEKQDQQKSSQANQSQSGEGQEREQNPEESQNAQFAQMGRMTPEQARQLLDAQKGEEKALIFIPQQNQSKQQNPQQFKDW